MKSPRFERNGSGTALFIPLALLAAAVPGMVRAEIQPSQAPLGMSGTLGFSTSNDTGVDWPWLSGPLTDASAIAVQVLDDLSLQPLAGAEVAISDSPGTTGIASQTTADGKASLTPASSNPQVITASLDGYATTVVVGVTTNQVTLYLKAAAAGSSAIMSGTMGNYTVPPDSGRVRAGLVFRTLSAADLIEFSPEVLISPLQDTINAFGSRKIPSNIVLPDQTVSVFPVSVHLDKPQYRFPLPPSRLSQLASLQGDADASAVVSAANGSGASAWFNLFNKMNLNSVGVTSTFAPTGDSTLDAPTSLDLTPVHQVTAPAAPFPGDTLLIAATDLTGDRQSLVPTDIKSNGTAGTAVTLRSTADNLGTDRDVMAVATQTDGARLSGVFVAQAGPEVNVGPFLPVDALPSFDDAPASVSVQAPANGIASITFSISDGSAVADSGSVYEYVFVLPAAGDVQIPTPGTPDSYAVTQLEFSSNFNEQAIDGLTELQELGRFTRTEGRKNAQ